MAIKVYAYTPVIGNNIYSGHVSINLFFTNDEDCMLVNAV